MQKDVDHIDSTAGYGIEAPSDDHQVLRTQVEVIRDVMLSAADCNTWLTLHEIAEMTRFGEASISAQLRHLRKPAYGEFHVQKRRRYGAGELMVVRERQAPRARKSGGRGSAPTAGSKERGESAAWRRAYGIKPGDWEYRVARSN